MQNNLVHRIGLAVEEARTEHSLSKAGLARLAGVSSATVRRLEGGNNVRPDLAVRIALAMTVVDLYRLPAPGSDEGLAALPAVAPGRVTLPREAWAA
jgi:DNA-binding XRE family transcriptional regulator